MANVEEGTCVRGQAPACKPRAHTPTLHVNTETVRHKLELSCLHEDNNRPVIHRSGSWFPGPPLSPVSWWNCWTCCWGRRSRSCLCTFCGVCWWTHSHKLAAGLRRGRWSRGVRKRSAKVSYRSPVTLKNVQLLIYLKFVDHGFFWIHRQW